jgi:hypothetical protein
MAPILSYKYTVYVHSSVIIRVRLFSTMSGSRFVSNGREGESGGRGKGKEANINAWQTSELILPKLNGGRRGQRHCHVLLNAPLEPPINSTKTAHQINRPVHGRPTPQGKWKKQTSVSLVYSREFSIFQGKNEQFDLPGFVPVYYTV